MYVGMQSSFKPNSLDSRIATPFNPLEIKFYLFGGKKLYHYGTLV